PELDGQDRSPAPRGRRLPDDGAREHGLLERVRAWHVPEHVGLRPALLLPPARLLPLQADAEAIRHPDAARRRLRPRRDGERHPREQPLVEPAVHRPQPRRLDRVVRRLALVLAAALALGGAAAGLLLSRGGGGPESSPP